MKPLYIAVLGEVDGKVAAGVEYTLESRLGRPVRRLQFEEPEFAKDERRGQYGSVPVLRMLAERRPAGAWKLLGITRQDLFIPMLTFVFGQAQLDGGAAVISVARLRQEFYGLPADAALLMTRARKEALHEIGHTMGLVHCADRRCAMALATNIRQLDHKGSDFCAVCGQWAGRRAMSDE